MKRILFTALILIQAATCWATIINIPDDYPTIQEGVVASVEGDTVLVQPGIYVENVILIGNNLTLGSLFLITGNTSYIWQTVIDGDSAGTVIWIANHEDSTTLVSGFTITNGFGVAGGIEITRAGPRISHNIITKNHGTDGGGGIDCYEAYPIISNNVIEDNIADYSGGGIYSYGSEPVISYNEINNNTATNPLGWGGGIYCWVSHAFLNNNIIHHNTLPGMGGGICCMAGNPVMINNLFFANEASDGGGVYCSWAKPEITNCILWDDSPTEIATDCSLTPEVTYSDIEGGYEGIGNINIYPLYRDTADGDFHLMSTACGDPEDSRCIDSGDPNILDGFLDCSWGLGGVWSDMGAYGGGDSLVTGVFDNALQIPGDFIVLQNYPNPFNVNTTIRFVLPKRSYVTITVYNILGQKIELLYEGIRSPGVHNINWDAGCYPSGIYFAGLDTKDISKNIKMILLK